MNEQSNIQFSIVFNSELNNQLEQLATKKGMTKAKLIKRLVNDSYLDSLQKER